MTDRRFQHIEDLRTAAKYLLLDGYSVDVEDAVRIGMMLAEMAGAFAQGIEAPSGGETTPNSVTS